MQNKLWSFHRVVSKVRNKKIYKEEQGVSKMYKTISSGDCKVKQKKKNTLKNRMVIIKEIIKIFFKKI